MKTLEHLAACAGTWRGSNRLQDPNTNETGELSVRGSYSAGEGPEWGWRISIAPGVQRLRMVMFNIDPGGREELAVESEYARLAAT